VAVTALARHPPTCTGDERPTSCGDTRLSPARARLLSVMAPADQQLNNTLVDPGNSGEIGRRHVSRHSPQSL